MKLLEEGLTLVAHLAPSVVVFGVRVYGAIVNNLAASTTLALALCSNRSSGRFLAVALAVDCVELVLLPVTERYGGFF